MARIDAGLILSFAIVGYSVKRYRRNNLQVQVPSDTRDIYIVPRPWAPQTWATRQGQFAEVRHDVNVVGRDLGSIGG